MFTAFLMDRGRTTGGMNFPYREEEHHFFNRALPEKAIGYESAFFNSAFEKLGMEPHGPILFGSWRKDQPSQSGFPQDVLFYRKQ